MRFEFEGRHGRGKADEWRRGACLIWYLGFRFSAFGFSAFGFFGLSALGFRLSAFGFRPSGCLIWYRLLMIALVFHEILISQPPEKRRGHAINHAFFVSGKWREEKDDRHPQREGRACSSGGSRDEVVTSSRRQQHALLHQHRRYVQALGLHRKAMDSCRDDQLRAQRRVQRHTSICSAALAGTEVPYLEGCRDHRGTH